MPHPKAPKYEPRVSPSDLDREESDEEKENGEKDSDESAAGPSSSSSGADAATQTSPGREMDTQTGPTEEQGTATQCDMADLPDEDSESDMSESTD